VAALNALPVELLAVAGATVGLIALAKALGVTPGDVRRYVAAFRDGAEGDEEGRER